MSGRPRVYHIPVCPFSQRLEILLALKGRQDAVEFEVVDITQPRDPALLEKTRGTTALPILETPEGGILKESLVILHYLGETVPGPPVRRTDPFEHALENMLIVKEGAFTTAGYMLLMNQDTAARRSRYERLLAVYAEIDDFLLAHAGGGNFLFSGFGLAEAVFTPMFMRFWLLEYYEEFELPGDGRFDRVRRWREACLAHPAAQQVCREEIIKLYYDYALGFGNGALPPGRVKSSFAFTPHWQQRPWPPAGKYGTPTNDAELGLV